MKITLRKILSILAILAVLAALTGCPGAGSGTDPAGTTAVYSVTYNANGAASGSVPVDSTEYFEGGTVTVTGNSGTLVKTSSVFAGWCTTADKSGTVYQAGDSFAIGAANVTLYARWIDFQKAAAGNDTATNGMYFGQSAALSADGAMALIGAAEDDEKGTDSGAVYVFERSGGSYSQTDIIYPPSSAAGDTFGYSVDISSDGTVAVVGAPKVDVDTDGLAGAVYIFVLESGVWTHKQKIENPTPDGDQFGESVAVSGDGKTITAAAPQKRVSGMDMGCVYVYTSSDSWANYSGGVINRSTTVELGYLGTGLDISYDGSRIIAGAPDDETLIEGTAVDGSVIVFDTDDNWTTFSEEAMYPPDDSGYFGSSVSCSDNGTILCIGAPEDCEKADYAGSAYIYKEVSGGWELQEKIYSEAPAEEEIFGASTAVSSNGSSVAVGAIGTDSFAGSVSFFEQYGSSWKNTMNHSDPDGAADDEYGTVAAVSSDGSTMLATSIYNYPKGSAIFYFIED